MDRVRPHVFAHIKQDRLILENAEDASAYTGSTDVSALTTSTNHREGSVALSFAKSGTTQAFGQIARTLPDNGKLNLADYLRGKLRFWINLSSLTDIANVQLIIGENATDNYVYQVADTALTTGWNEVSFNIDSPTSTGGAGAAWSSINYFAVKVNFDAAGNTLSAILVDAISAIYEVNINVESINITGTGLATAANQSTTNTALGTPTDASADGDAASGSIIARLRYLAKAVAAVIAGSSKLAVMNSDGTNVGAIITTTVTGSANGAGQFAVTAIDVSAYKKISMQTYGTYSLTQAFECSNDNVNWVNCPMQNVASVPLAENTGVTGGGQGIYECTVNFKYFRNRISAYTSGTINTTVLFSTLNGSPATQPVWAGQDGVWTMNVSNNVPFGATSVTGSSGNVANASAVGTLGTAVSRTTYITGFEVTGLGATAAGVVLVAVTGTIGGTLTYVLPVPAGVTAPLTPLIVEFTTPIAASATNTQIVVTVPALGAGNTNAAVVAHGYHQ